MQVLQEDRERHLRKTLAVTEEAAEPAGVSDDVNVGASARSELERGVGGDKVAFRSPLNERHTGG